MNEIAKVATEEVTKTANGLLSRIFGPAADSLGLIIDQPIRMRLVKNQIKALKKVQAICENENINIRQVNLKVLLPYLQGIAVEEEPELEEMWANLMANYLDSEKKLVNIVFPEILRQLSKREAEILTVIIDKKTIIVVPEDSLLSNRNENFNYSEVCNLDRMGLIKERLTLVRYRMNGAQAIKTHGNKEFIITHFGLEFYKACQR